MKDVEHWGVDIRINGEWVRLEEVLSVIDRRIIEMWKIAEE